MVAGFLCNNPQSALSKILSVFKPLVFCFIKAYFVRKSTTSNSEERPIPTVQLSVIEWKVGEKKKNRSSRPIKAGSSFFRAFGAWLLQIFALPLSRTKYLSKLFRKRKVINFYS